MELITYFEKDFTKMIIIDIMGNEPENKQKKKNDVDDDKKKKISYAVEQLQEHPSEVLSKIM